MQTKMKFFSILCFLISFFSCSKKASQSSLNWKNPQIKIDLSLDQSLSSYEDLKNLQILIQLDQNPPLRFSPQEEKPPYEIFLPLVSENFEVEENQLKARLIHAKADFHKTLHLYSQDLTNRVFLKLDRNGEINQGRSSGVVSNVSLKFHDIRHISTFMIFIDFLEAQKNPWWHVSFRDDWIPDYFHLSQPPLVGRTDFVYGSVLLHDFQELELKAKRIFMPLPQAFRETQGERNSATYLLKAKLQFDQKQFEEKEISIPLQPPPKTVVFDLIPKGRKFDLLLKKLLP